MSDRGDPQIKTEPPKADAPAPKAPDVAHKQAHDDATEPVVDPDKIDHSMNEEEKLGWDQAPKDPADMPGGSASNTRHPRQLGQGGTLTPGQALTHSEHDESDTD
jgi:hypothetical protein